MSGVVREHDNVVIELQCDDRYVVIPRLRAGTAVKGWKKSKFDAGKLLGQPYGTLFEVRNGELVRLEEPPDVGELLRLAKTHGEDNRSIKMAGDAQGLTQEQIEAMKKEGKRGEEIVAALMANSATLEAKTAFAQEKWLKKKLAKYVSFFRIVRPTGAALARVFWSKDPQKVERMRWDALAWMLNCADLRHGTRPLVVDGVSGLLTGAVVERVYGQCQVTSLFHSTAEPRHITSFFNFPAEVTAKLEFVRFEQFKPADNVGTFESLLAAVNYNPDPLLRHLWPSLVAGGSFVIYSQYAAAFEGVFAWLRREQCAVEIKLTEIFFREYQVLEGRTHPDMQMDNASGFVLTGVKTIPHPFVANANQAVAAERKMDRSKKKKQRTRD
jgi:tRNA (adenine-N(1)-)-methyltransferase non-catalytic subunit